MSINPSDQSKKGGSAGGRDSLFDFDGEANRNNHQASVGDEDANYGSPTSSQFVHRDKSKVKKNTSLKQQQKQLNQRMINGIAASTNQKESLEEALVDLYLSVKIRSNEEIDAYNEDILSEERERLRETNPFTILEYIKTSIEILMNMKMEEQQENNQEKHKSKRHAAKKKDDGEYENDETESVLSGDEAPSEYEGMLQKYEAEVRNHIKIEQQLKLHIECVQDKLEDQEKLLKKEVDSKEKESSDRELELKRYKDLLSLREKEISKLNKDTEQMRLNDDNLKKRVNDLEQEKQELSGQLLKKQRGVSPFKVESRSQYQMMEDLQDAIMAKGPIAEEDLRNNYNQYIAGSRTQKNGNSNKIMATTLPSHGVTQQSSKAASTSLTNQTMYIFKSSGSTERVNSSSKNKQHLTDQKFKKDFIQKTKGQSDRAYLNRSAMSTGKPDINAITISQGKSPPDRSKNMSVYSQGQSLAAQISQVNSHQGSSGVIGSNRSPYLGVQSNVGHQGSGQTSIKKRIEKAESGHRKKESMLANATYKNAMINANGNLTNQQVKNLANQSGNNVHNRTKSQNAGSVNLKLQSMQNYQQKIQENNQLIQSLSSQQHNQSQQIPHSGANFSIQQQASEESLDQNLQVATAIQQQKAYNQAHNQYMSQPQGGQPVVPVHSQTPDIYNTQPHQMQQLSQSQIQQNQLQQQPGQQPTGPVQQMMHHGIQQIPTNIISGTYINSNIIVHHQKTKSTSSGTNGGRKHSAKQAQHQIAQANQQQQQMIAQRQLLNNTVNGHYPTNSNLTSALQGMAHRQNNHTPDLVDKHGKLIAQQQMIPQHHHHHQVNQVNSNLISASGGHMRAGSYHVPDRAFHSTQQLNMQQKNSAGGKNSNYLANSSQHSQAVVKNSNLKKTNLNNTGPINKVQGTGTVGNGVNQSNGSTNVRQRSLKHHTQQQQPGQH